MAISMLPGPALRERTTLRLGGPAVAEISLGHADDVEGLPEALASAGGIPLVLGQGSNLLVRDGDTGLTLVTLPKPGVPEARDAGENVIVQADAGLRLPRLLGWLAGNGLSGLEGLSGIPGSVGGAMAMNAGSYGTEMIAVLERVRVFTPATGLAWLSPDQVDAAYRHFAPKGLEHGALYLVTEVEVRCTRDEPAAIRERMRENFMKKKTTQPVHAATAGCVFKNPAPGVSAGKLLDEAGFKGKRIGNMRFSDVHANFLENMGNGRSDDGLELMDTAKAAVRAQSGHELETEVRILP